MSERVAEYQRLVERIMAPETAENPKLSDDESDALYDQLDVLWAAMSPDELQALDTWRKDRQS